MSIVPDTKMIILNSLYSTPSQSSGTYQKSYLSNVLFNTKAVLQDDPKILYTTIGIDSAVIPRSFYNINYTNNILGFFSYKSYKPLFITITKGHYSMKQLITELTNKINASGRATVIGIYFDLITGKITLSLDGQFILYSIFNGSTALDWLGFDPEQDNYSNAAGVLTSDNSVNIIGIKLLKIVSNSLLTNALSSQSGGFFSQQNILGLIPVISGEYTLITYNNSNDRDPLLLNKNVNSIDISIFDEYNNYVNFNGIEWSINLRLTSYRQIDFNIAPSIIELSNQLSLGKNNDNEKVKEPEYGDIDMLLYQKNIDI